MSKKNSSHVPDWWPKDKNHNYKIDVDELPGRSQWYRSTAIAMGIYPFFGKLLTIDLSVHHQPIFLMVKSAYVWKNKNIICWLQNHGKTIPWTAPDSALPAHPKAQEKHLQPPPPADDCWFFMGLPSGNGWQFAIENGPVEIVDFPSYIAWWIFPISFFG